MHGMSVAVIRCTSVWNVTVQGPSTLHKQTHYNQLLCYLQCFCSVFAFLTFCKFTGTTVTQGNISYIFFHFSVDLLSDGGDSTTFMQLVTWHVGSQNRPTYIVPLEESQCTHLFVVFRIKYQKLYLCTHFLPPAPHL